MPSSIGKQFKLAFLIIFFSGCIASKAMAQQSTGDVPVVKAKLLLDAKVVLAEGSLWQPKEQKLYWVNIVGKTFHIYDPKTDTDTKYPVGSLVGTVVPTANGNAVVALQNGISELNTHTGELTMLADPIKNPGIRFNDGKCDPAGRFWVGTMALDAQKGAATLYRMDKDHSVHTMLKNVTISNGIVWTSDKKTMYYVDTPTGTVQAFDYNNKTGEISNGRVAVRIPSSMGSPDGMTIDANDNLWVALWGGGAIAEFNPRTGKLLKKVEVPAPHTSSCAFGGKNLETLYITTARQGMNKEQLKQYPLSGGLFVVKPGAKGVPADFYKGELPD